jgi:hypothetical protein
LFNLVEKVEKLDFKYRSVSTGGASSGKKGKPLSAK